MTALAALNTQACAAVVASQPSSIAGPWHGQIAVAGVSLGIVVVFTETPDSGLSATIDIPQQGARGLALRHVTRDGDRVRFELPAGPGPAVFDGRLADGRISGSFTQAGIPGTFTLSPGGPEADRPAPAEPVPCNRDVTVKTYERANHLFIPATTGLPSEYATLEKTFVPGLLDDIFSWLSARVMQ